MGMTPESYHSYKDIDWADLSKRLHVFARQCRAQMPDVFDGMSGEDVVNEVLTLFFEDPNGLGWNPEVGPLAPFLLGVWKNKRLDHLRRERRTAGSLDDPDFLQGIHLTTNKDQRIDEFRADLKKAARGDPRLEAFVEALAKVDGHNTNQQLAEELNTIPEEIVNLKKRLSRRYKSLCHEKTRRRNHET